MAGLLGPALGLGRRGPSPTRKKAGGSWVLLQGVPEALPKPPAPISSLPSPSLPPLAVLLGTGVQDRHPRGSRKGRI